MHTVTRVGSLPACSDDVDGRLIAMSLNLSQRDYDGGVFELRERRSSRILTTIHNTGFSDATLFRISDRLAHQVTAVVGEHPKTAFAGWFHADKPDLMSRLPAGQSLVC